MNGKTAKKLLMRGRDSVFWGRRAFLTVRLPLSLVPEPVPPRVPVDRVGESTGMGGYWKRSDENGHTVLTAISHPSSGGDPQRFIDRGEIKVPVYHVNHESYEYDETDDDGKVIGKETSHHYDWWEIHEYVFDNYDTPEQKQIEDRAGSADLVDMYRARKQWIEKYTQGRGGEGTGIPVLDGFLVAAYWAKTTYESVDEARGWFYITYSVKWFYSHRKRGFARDLSRAMKRAKKAGVLARVVGLQPSCMDLRRPRDVGRSCGRSPFRSIRERRRRTPAPTRSSWMACLSASCIGSTTMAAVGLALGTWAPGRLVSTGSSSRRRRATRDVATPTSGSVCAPWWTRILKV